MASRSSVLHQYQLIASLSSQMRAKAEAQQWDDVVQLGAQYNQAVEDLRRFSPLDDADRNARRELLTRILDDDARIRHLAAPELLRLGHLMGAIKRQRTVLRAYHASSE
ncbi:flagellar protein FliT [Castellaniella sp. GW247-6E4]|uniref:flagellar protein FliT n=1 Tax=Castellaniella sp. GW247-6E4 TaxID=3140380 RepID=UPI003315456A